MADFGTLNFSVSLNPTSAFPLDARCYFKTLESAMAAAATAEEAGSTNTVYYIGQRLVVVTDSDATWYTIQPDKSLRVDGTGSVSSSANAVIFDGPQELTEEQKAQARANIGITLYEGAYSVTPETDVAQILRTSGTLLDSDIVIEKIPYSEVTNTSNGTTATIGQ